MLNTQYILQVLGELSKHERIDGLKVLGDLWSGDKLKLAIKKYEATLRLGLLNMRCEHQIDGVNLEIT